jgi:N-acetylmuramate 1-kinase
MPAPAFPALLPWAPAAASAPPQSWRTQFFGQAHKSLRDVTSVIVLSAPIGKQKANTVTPTSRSPKTDLLLRKTRIHFPRLDDATVEITAIEKGGSDRKFYRVRCSPEQTIILVKYGFEREENRHYVKIAEFLAEHKIRAPRIYFHDAAEGLIWIEDLGKADLWSYREENWLVRRAFYESALNEIVKLHCLPEEAGGAIEQDLPVAFDAALYRWEQNYFFKNCLGGYFGVDEKKLSKLTALPALHELAEHLGNRPRVMVHRDFQSQNIIMRNAQAHLIDFQGMRPGLAEYDLASLLFDPYVTFSRSERDELLTAYEEKREAALLPVLPQFREIFRLCAIQRLMQALGFYGFAAMVKGNKTFLNYVPAAMMSLRSLVSEIASLDELRAVLDRQL